MHTLNKPFTLNNYQIHIYQLKDEWIYDTESSSEKQARSVRLLIEYANHMAEPLKYSPYHWQLFDTEGYHYQLASYNGYYAADVRRRLQEGTLTSGQTVKGWIAFNPPADAILSFIRFTPPGFNSASADIALLGERPKQPATPKNPPSKPLWKRLLHAVIDKTPPSPEPIPPVKQLTAGTGYKVLKPFEDYHGRMFIPGDILTFIQYQPPYLGLHILEFKEATVHLHTETNADILGRLFDYLG